MKFNFVVVLIACAFAFCVDATAHLKTKAPDCAFSITIEQTMSVENASTTRTVSHCSYFGLLQLESKQEDDGDVVTTLTRFDLAKKEKGVVYVPQFVHNSSKCVKNMVSLDEAKDGALFNRNLLIVDKDFDGKNETEFNGIPCDVYYYEAEAGGKVYVGKYYVDDSDRLIGIFTNFPANATATIVYEDAPNLTSFAFDKTFSGCDEQSYVPPPSDYPCQTTFDVSSSSSSVSPVTPSSSHKQSSSHAPAPTPVSSHSTSKSGSATTYVSFFLVAFALALVSLF